MTFFKPSKAFAANKNNKNFGVSQPATDPQGAGPSGGPTARGSAQKRRAAPTLFGGRPKKPKGSAAATKRDEAAAKAARFCKVVKQPQAVSA